MELVGQMYKLSACFDTPNEYKGLPYDYFPDDAVSYGSTICSFGLPYNDHNYGMPTGLTPPVMAPHLMDPVAKPKKLINDLFAKAKCEPSCELDAITGQPVANSQLLLSTDSSSPPPADASLNCTPRKQYLDENDYPVYVEPEIKVVEVPEKLCVSASEYSDCSSESSDDTKVNPEFLIYLRSLASRHESVERYLNRARRQYEQYAHSQKSSGSEKRECSMTSDIVIDCICEYSYDDKRMVQCEACGIKQHLDCMYANPRQVQNFLKHRCQKCSDIKVDIPRAKAIQNSRKNWHLNNQVTDKIPQRCKIKTEDRKNKDFLMKIKETKNEGSSNENAHSNSKNNCNIARVNKRKQDLKVYGEPDTVSIPSVMKTLMEEDEEVPDALEPKAAANNNQLSDLLKTNKTPELQEPDMKPDLFVPSSEFSEELGGKLVDGPEYSPVVEEYPERLAIINRRNPPFKKDYKEATKSLYTGALLAKIEEMKESEEEKQTLLANANVEGLEQGTEFLDRNPRCRIVLFDGCTMGLEASVRLQSCSIVAAMIGRMMLMEEYLKYASPAAEYKPFVFLYHGFGDHGLVVDTTVYGNIARYLRRSCDPNVKLEHTIVGGSLYIVIRTTTEICQGVELTIPFDLPFEICQYPVQCACGKVRCPAIKHRRKHHRNRIITSNINCEQVIEDKLRELSQPLLSSTSTYTGNVSGLKKPIIANRFGIQSRQIIESYSDALESKNNSSSLHNDSKSKSQTDLNIITEDRIKREEKEPSPQELEEEPKSPRPPPPINKQQISSDLCGDAILTTKRRPKPVQHPDFEVDIINSSRATMTMSDRSRNSSRSSHNTPIKTKIEPSLKRALSNTDNLNIKSPSKSLNNKEMIIDRLYAAIQQVRELIHILNDSNDEIKYCQCCIWKSSSATFKSIITTRQQKRNKSPNSNNNKRGRSAKMEPLEEETATKRSNRAKK